MEWGERVSGVGFRLQSGPTVLEESCIQLLTFDSEKVEGPRRNRIDGVVRRRRGRPPGIVGVIQTPTLSLLLFVSLLPV